MNERPSRWIQHLFVLFALSVCLAVGHLIFSDNGHVRIQRVRKNLVEPLGLSDLTLFTEARYTRHPSMADLHSAFQDHPVSIDHFPTGSLIGPPVWFAGAAKTREVRAP